MNEKLKVCPFCNGNAIADSNHPQNGYTARCAGECEAEIWGGSLEKAINDWNRRFVCLDKDGAKVFAGDEFNFNSKGRPPIKLHFVWSKQRLRWLYENDQSDTWIPKSSDNITLIESKVKP